MITLRGHHLICRLGFRGLGYSESFTKKMGLVVCELNNPKAVIQVVAERDILCNSCPKIREGLCASDGNPIASGRIKCLDQMVMDVLGLMPYDTLTVSKLDRLVKERFTMSIFDVLCPHCRWRSYGYCAEGLATLLAGQKSSPRVTS